MALLHEAVRDLEEQFDLFPVIFGLFLEEGRKSVRYVHLSRGRDIGYHPFLRSDGDGARLLAIGHWETDPKIRVPKGFVIRNEIWNDIARGREGGR